MSTLLQPFHMLARAVGDAARAALWRSALIGAAMLLATIGAGFLLIAGYLGLRLVLDPAPAALVMGLALMIVAAVLVMVSKARSKKSKKPSGPADVTLGLPASLHAQPRDLVAMAIFTAAFLFGRRMAGRRDAA
jgi:multisubunit Na+/H+ antiporter MnhC subunit